MKVIFLDYFPCTIRDRTKQNIEKVLFNELTVDKWNKETFFFCLRSRYWSCEVG